MVIGIDLWAINCSRNHGIGNYAEEFCRELLRARPDDQYVFLNWSGERICEDLFGKDMPFQEALVGDVSGLTESDTECVIRAFVSENRVDLYLDSSPVWGSRPLLKHTWFGEHTKLACIAFDLIPYVLREQYYAYRDADGFKNYIKRMYNLSQYDYIYSISNSTKSDIEKYVGIPGERIITIYCSTGKTGHERAISGESDIQERLHIDAGYFLYPAGDAVQKNLSNLLLGYVEAAKACDTIPVLVITGKFFARSRQMIDDIIASNNMEGKIILTGFITEEELDALYKECKWVLYPSIYEGFGMPVVEGWEHEKPVLTANGSSLVEIAEGAAVLVDPTRIEEIREGLLKITKMSEEERREFIEKGRERVKIFSWKNTVQRFIESLEKMPVNAMSDKDSIDLNQKAKKRIDEEMAEWDEERTRRGIVEESAEKKQEKIRRYYALLNRWMTARAQGLSIERYLINNNFRKIALYGMGVMASH